MKIGVSVKTLPTVKPKLYAGKTGTIAIKNENEVGVLIAGRVVWFLEREIEECQTSGFTVSMRDGQNARESNGFVGGTTSASVPTRQSNASELTARESGGLVPGSPQRVVTKPPSAVPASESLSPPESVSAPSGGSGEAQELIQGERGPGGGVVARCQACGGLWERPKARGRPALKCEECR